MVFVDLKINNNYKINILVPNPINKNQTSRFRSSEVSAHSGKKRKKFPILVMPQTDSIGQKFQFVVDRK